MASTSYFIHCLTDGSEYTGASPTLLLEIQRHGIVKKRYALSGLSCIAARLSADQRVPLHNIAAVFLPTSHDMDGLESLKLTLRASGSPNVVVVGTLVDRLENVTSCQVPTDGEWYQVYQDDELVVHAKSGVGNELVFIYSLTTISFAVGTSNMTIGALPDYVAGRHGTLQCTIVTNATVVPLTGYFTLSNSTTGGLLMRATHQATLLNEALPICFPFNAGRSHSARHERQLLSCSTLVLRDGTITTTKQDEILATCLLSTHEKVPLPVEPFQSAWLQPIDENEIDLDDDKDKGRASTCYNPVPHLLVLGTGCASPSPRRGSSGYALFLPNGNRHSLVGVVECGEGFVTNLSRHLPFQCTTVQEQLQSIRFIWISHAHLDHYGGLPSLLREVASSSVTAEPSAKRMKPTSACAVVPIVIAPSKVLKYVDSMLQCQNGKSAVGGRRMYYGVTHVELETSPFCKELREGLFGTSLLRDHVGNSSSSSNNNNHASYCPIQLLRSIPVDHCPQAHGLILSLRVPNQRPVTLCYSGDTRPSRNLVRSCQNINMDISLLIHEATFDDDEHGLAEATKKRHSTVLEALGVAKDMRAEACLMTHFSQRYPKTPPGNGVVQGVGFAMDGMCIPLTPEALALLPELSRVTAQVLLDSFRTS